jgi:hypothetical protein
MIGSPGEKLACVDQSTRPEGFTSIAEWEFFGK